MLSIPIYLWYLDEAESHRIFLNSKFVLINLNNELQRLNGTEKKASQSEKASQLCCGPNSRQSYVSQTRKEQVNAQVTSTSRFV